MCALKDKANARGSDECRRPSQVARPERKGLELRLGMGQDAGGAGGQQLLSHVRQ